MSQMLLNYLKSTMTQEEYLDYTTYQKKQIDYYNTIISKKNDTSLISSSINELSSIHLFMLFIKNHDEKNEIIIRKLKEVHPEINQTMKAHSLMSYNKLYFIQ